MPRRIVLLILGLLMLLGWTLFQPTLLKQTQMESARNSVVHAAPIGYKALFTLFQQVYGQNTVGFWSHSPVKLPRHHAQTLWFLEPGPGVFMDGKTYGAHLRSLAQEGTHFVFVLNPIANVPPSDTAPENAQGRPMIEFIQNWFNLPTQWNTQLKPLESYMELETRSRFKTRLIDRLGLNLDEVVESLGPASSREDISQLSSSAQMLQFFNAYCKEPECQQPLKWVGDEVHPMVVSYPIGQGRVTLVNSTLFFKNSQLNREDNAALAIAIQELQTIPGPIWFDGYSQGLRDNPDLLTLLAQGQGRPLLISLFAVMVCFCWSLSAQPQRWIQSLTATDDRFYTQERFFDAMAAHALAHPDWSGLLNQLGRQFLMKVQQRYPQLPLKEALKLVASVQPSVIAPTRASLEKGAAWHYAKVDQHQMVTWLEQLLQAPPFATEPEPVLLVQSPSDFLGYAEALKQFELSGLRG